MWPADQRKSLSTSTWLWGACIWTRGFGSGSEELEGAQPCNVLVISPSSRTGTAVLCSHRALQAKAATQQRDGGQAPNVESRGRMGGGEKTRKNKTPKNKECTIANDVSISTSNEELCDMHGAHGLRTQLRSWHTGRESRQQAAWQTAWTTTSSGTRASLLLPART